MTAIGARTITLPPALEARMWHTNAQPVTVEGLSFFDFMTLPELSMPRPKEDGIADHEEGTAHKYHARVRQAYREIDALQQRDALTTGATPAIVGSAWETTPPNHEHIWKWRNDPSKGSPARLETHRKALVWKYAYHGIVDNDLPPFMRKTWATKKRVSRAIKAGISRKRTRFLQLPDDISTMLASKPFTGALRHGKMWRDDNERAEKAYLDDLWHTLIGMWPVGPRPQDYAVLKLEWFQPTRGGILGWSQRKKEGEDDEHRDAIVPETWLWTSDGRWYPSLQWYIETVRPRAVQHGRELAANADQEYVEPKEVFLQWDGAPYRRLTLRNLISEGMLRSLGPRSSGPHGLRRACATWRRRHGWSIKAIAELLSDTEKVVDESYLDHAWLRQRENRPKREGDMPEVPIIRSSGKPDLWIKKGKVWTHVGNEKPQKAPKGPLWPIPGRDEVVAPHGAKPRSRPGDSHKNAENGACEPAEAAEPSSFPYLAQPALSTLMGASA